MMQQYFKDLTAGILASEQKNGAISARKKFALEVARLGYRITQDRNPAARGQS